MMFKLLLIVGKKIMGCHLKRSIDSQFCEGILYAIDGWEA
jgi:hypothetical protein